MSGIETATRAPATTAAQGPAARRASSKAGNTVAAPNSAVTARPHR